MIEQFGMSTACTECEAMLADALDGTLGVEEQAQFDGHVAHCVECSQMLADARRGAAWVEMLKTPRPEPQAALLERILTATSNGLGAADGRLMDGLRLVQPVPVAAAMSTGMPRYGNVLPFRSRFLGAVRSSFVSTLMQPRLAMTAAMAFLSLALTMDLTGVRLQDFKVSDLRPANLERSYYDVNARVVRYYEGLRVVDELESRVRDLEQVSDGDEQAPDSTNDGVQQQTAPQQVPDQQKPAPKPQQKRQGGAGGGTGTSRREDLIETRRLVASTTVRKSFGEQERKRV
jgi:Putative zinc-finger